MYEWVSRSKQRFEKKIDKKMGKDTKFRTQLDFFSSAHSNGRFRFNL